MEKSLFFLFFLNIYILQAQETTFTLSNFEVGIVHAQFYDKIVGGGAAFFDYNNDNLEDLYLTGGTLGDKLCVNNGDGTFSNIAYLVGLNDLEETVTIGCVTGDIDNDGYRDIFVTTAKGTPNILYRNRGDGIFENISVASGIQLTEDGTMEEEHSFSATMGDVNLDGLLDIYVTNWVDTTRFISENGVHLGFDHVCSPNRLYINNGDLTFSEVSNTYNSQDLGCGLVCSFSDFDNDRDLDLFVVNDFGEWVNSDGLYENSYPDPFFKDISEETHANSELYGMGLGIGDFDQDGDLDYYKTNIGRNLLLRNNDNIFEDVTDQFRVDDTYSEPGLLSVGWGAGFTDLNNDTYLDLIVANGKMYTADFISSAPQMSDKIFLNLEGQLFEDITAQSNAVNMGASRGLAYADYDNDGDMDFIMNCTTPTNANWGFSTFFKNNLDNDRNWLKVKLIGTINNRDAFGTHLSIYVNEKNWLHEISGGGQGHCSQHTSIAHFGLNEAEKVDSLKIIWPGHESEIQTFYDIAPNDMIIITEGINEYEVWNNDTTTIVDTTVISSLKPIDEEKKFNIFPNPATNFVHFQFPNLTEPTTLLIFNQFGQTVNSFIVTTDVFTWNTLDQKNIQAVSGIYFAVLQSKNYQFGKSFVIHSN